MLRREYLIRLREDNNLTREFVSKQLGITARYFKKIEDGSTLSTEILTKYFIPFSKLYGISVMDLSAMETMYQLSRIEVECSEVESGADGVK